MQNQILNQNQAKQAPGKVNLTLYRGMFYQGEETRSHPPQTQERRMGKWKKPGRGWSFIKRTFLTPLGTHGSLDSKKKLNGRRHLPNLTNDDTEADTNSYRTSESRYFVHSPGDACQEEEAASLNHPYYSPHHQPTPPTYEDYPPDYQDHSTKHQQTSPSPYQTSYLQEYVTPWRYQDHSFSPSYIGTSSPAYSSQHYADSPQDYRDQLQNCQSKSTRRFPK